MKNSKPKPAFNPVERTIASKERLVVKLRKEIEAVRAEANEEIIGIEYRIKLAQTLIDALKKGK